MKKHILQVIAAMNRGGAEMMLMELVRVLHSEIRFTFLITRKKGTQPVGDFDEELRSLGIPLYYIDSVWDVGVREYARQFRAVIQQIEPVDAIHSHLNMRGGIIAKCAAECGIGRRIVHSHAKLKNSGSLLSYIIYYSELYLQRRWIKRYATDFWGCSEDSLFTLYDEEQRRSPRMKIIHNAIQLEKFSRHTGATVRSELGISDSAFVIGTVGRIAAVKNYELAADIIAELWKRGVNCHYIVAGRRQTESCVAYLFNKLGADPRFHYIGERGDLPAVYHAFNLYLGTSEREGMPVTSIEAQACGKHCLFSTGFPSHCDMGAGLVSFIASSNAAQWADYIMNNCMNLPVVDMEVVEQAIRRSGFSIATEAQRVGLLYSEE